MTRAREAVVDVLRPLVTGDLVAWQGLPPLPAEVVEAALGPPSACEEVKLGWYPATRLRYREASLASPVDVYVRHGDVVLVEVEGGPPADTLEALGPPSAVMANEIVRLGAYVHEYVYGRRGLVLSVAQPFQEGRAWEIVRSRGIAPMPPDQPALGPDLHRSLEDTDMWR